MHCIHPISLLADYLALIIDLFDNIGMFLDLCVYFILVLDALIGGTDAGQSFMWVGGSISSLLHNMISDLVVRFRAFESLSTLSLFVVFTFIQRLSYSYYSQVVFDVLYTYDTRFRGEFSCISFILFEA